MFSLKASFTDSLYGEFKTKEIAREFIETSGYIPNLDHIPAEESLIFKNPDFPKQTLTIVEFEKPHNLRYLPRRIEKPSES